jgi:hypothetical protein
LKPEDFLLKDERVIEKFGTITLTTKRVIGEENVLRLLFGGLGNLFSSLLGMKSGSGFMQGTVVDISLGRIDSTELKIERSTILLIISNILWYATIVLLALIWVWPYVPAEAAEAFGIIAFILNLITLGLAQRIIDLLGGAVVALADSYDYPIWTFIVSSLFFIAYMLFKTITIRIYSANNSISTSLFDFSPTAKLEDAKEFLRLVRGAERDFLKK